MDIEKIQDFIKSQRTRDSRPMTAFTTSIKVVTRSAGELQNAKLSEDSFALISHLMVIHLVTIIECYFRDALGCILQLCKYNVFVPCLNKLIKQKYSLQEIIELEAEGLHFLDVIPGEMSFQRIDQISAAFDNFFPCGFLNEIQKRRFRFKKIPHHEMFVDGKTLAILGSMFSLRHENVHNPNEETIRSDIPDLGKFIEMAWNLVFCADAAIGEFIGANIRDQVNEHSPISGDKKVANGVPYDSH